MAAGHQRDIDGLAVQGFLQPYMIVFMQRGNHHEGRSVDRRFGEIEIGGHQAVGIRKRFAFGGRIIYGHRESHQWRKMGQSLRNTAMANDQQFRFGQHRLYEDVHHASAGHSHAQHFILHVESNEFRFFLLNAAQGHIAYCALGTAATYPSHNHFSVAGNNGLRSAPGRRRSCDLDYGGDGKRRTLRRELAYLGVKV